ncbi:MAG: NAD-dependent epimerase/dehydratase family protein, partial [Nocardioides sp.]|nr:NAD-dependent epimerase/dehydratase family protein [Nocardioides sp.]
VPPRGDIGGVNFVRADIRNPVIAKVIAKEEVDTVVHLSVIATPGSIGSRTAMKELNVIGTMQLLAACQTAPSLRQVVVKSTTQVYGASNRDPAMFTEAMEPRRTPTSGYARDAADIEGYVRGFARRREDVCVTVLRCANVLGPRIKSPIADHFRRPVIPSIAGFEPRLQFLHELDLYAVLAHTLRAKVPGTFNIAGDGVITHSQIIRRLQRPTLPIPEPLFGLYRFTGAEYPAELRSLLAYGRGVDTRRMREVLGFEPQYTTEQTVADFAGDLVPTGGRMDRALADLERRVTPIRTPRRAATGAAEHG